MAVVNYTSVRLDRPEVFPSIKKGGHGCPLSLRANIAETIPLALITEQGENRNQREKQWNLSGFSHGFACRGT
jgi:hypothetical protein